MPADPEDRLPCGVHVDDLLTQVAERTAPRDPEHQRTCRHCRAAVAELRVLWQPVDALAAEHVRAPADLLSAVMARVRELPRTVWHAEVPGDRLLGRTQVAARVVAAVARLAAESVPHVDSVIGGGRRPVTDVAVAGSHVVVDVELSVDYGVAIADVARQVRRQIARHLAEQTGLSVAEVNVEVTDVRVPRRPAHAGARRPAPPRR